MNDPGMGLPLTTGEASLTLDELSKLTGTGVGSMVAWRGQYWLVQGIDPLLLEEIKE